MPTGYCENCGTVTVQNYRWKRGGFRCAGCLKETYHLKNEDGTDKAYSPPTPRNKPGRGH